MPGKPRIQIIDPTPRVAPGLAVGDARGFSTARASAERTPIRLRISSGGEAPILWHLSWKTTASVPLVGTSIIDAPMRRQLLRRAGGPGSSAVLSGDATDAAALTAAIHTEFPGTKVGIYTNAERVPESTKTSGRMAAHFLANQGELLQRVAGGAKITGAAPNREFWVDITNAAAVAYIASECVAILDDYDADAIFVDSLQTAIAAENAIVDGAAKNAAWPQAAADMLIAIRAALDLEFGVGVKEIWGNCLWNQQRDLAHPSGLSQIERGVTYVLPELDMAECEMFGRSGLKTTSTYYQAGAEGFEAHVEEIATALGADNTPMVIRLAAPDAYRDVADELAAGLYAFACYLCKAWNANRHPIYHGVFNVQRLPAQRVYGNVVLGYLDLPLGAPLAAAVDDGDGGLSREFEGGWVFLAPDESGIHVWTLSEGLYTPRGQYLPSGSPISLGDGEALILLKRPRPPQPYRIEANLSDSAEEFLMEPTFDEYRRRLIRGRVRTTDIDACILVRAHVNEVNKPFGFLRILPIGGTAPSLQNKDYVYGIAGGSQPATHKSVTGLIADGEWHDFEIILADAFYPLEHFAIPSIRLIGDDIEVEYLELLDPQPIVPEIDLAAPRAFFTLAHNDLEVTPTDASVAPVGETIVSWEWTWGDGATASGQNPGSHVYELAGGKPLTLTVVASNGRSHSYTRVALPAVNADGPLRVSFPFTAAEFRATGQMPAQHGYNLSQPSGGSPNALDVIANGFAVDLTANLLSLFAQVPPIAGWTRGGVGFDETALQRLRNTTPGWLIGEVDLDAISVWYLDTPAAVRGLVTLATTQGVDIRHTSTNKVRLASGGNTVDSTADYTGDVFLLRNNHRPSQATNLLETNLNTPAPVSVNNGVPTGDDFGLGDVGAGSPNAICLALWVWRARAFTADHGTDRIALVDHGLVTGDGPVQVYTKTGVLPTGYVSLADYYVIRIDDDTLQLAESVEDAEDGVAVPISDNGTPVNYLRAVPVFEDLTRAWNWIEPLVEGDV